MKAAIALAALLTVASVAPGIAAAQSSPDPTFTGISANILKVGSDQGDLLFRWAETGFTPGQKVTVNYILSADATATYGCGISGPPKFCDDVGGTVSKGFSLSTTSGTIRQSASVDEPDPSSSCNTLCGGHVVLYQVTYGNMTIADTNQGGGSSSLPGPLSLTFCKANNLNNCPPPS